MKRIYAWRCSLCDSVFTEKYEAEECEKLHIPEKSLVITNTKHKRSHQYPTSVIIQDINTGDEKEYFITTERQQPQTDQISIENVKKKSMIEVQKKIDKFHKTGAVSL